MGKKEDMRNYTTPDFISLNKFQLYAAGQGGIYGAQAFSVSQSEDLEEDCGNSVSLDTWLVGILEAGANIQVSVVPADTSSDGPDIVIQILSGNGSQTIVPCVDNNGSFGTGESTSFTVPSTGNYLVQVYTNDNCCGNTFNDYTLTVSGAQLNQPATFQLDDDNDCGIAVCGA